MQLISVSLIVKLYFCQYHLIIAYYYLQKLLKPLKLTIIHLKGTVHHKM